MRIVSLTILGLAAYAWYQERIIKQLRAEVEYLHEVRGQYEIERWIRGAL